MYSVDLCSHFDSNIRAEALRKEAAEEDFPPPTTWVNAHAHTFYSFNYKGYSPSRFALEAKKAGLEMETLGQKRLRLQMAQASQVSDTTHQKA